MTGHDIIVIGTSAGGLKALSAVLSELPAGIGAAVFVVQHLAADKKSYLPKLLGDVSDLPVSSPADDETFLPGRVYVAAPDHHLLLNGDRVRVLRGPQENRFRPSIDALFRSAARSHGCRVIGMVLTGYLDDGTVGLQTIKKRGGITVVQDPEEADYPSMPRTALRYVKVDHTVPIADAGALLIRLVAEPPAVQDDFPTTPAIEIESNIAEQVMNTKEFLESVEQIGERTTYTCPDCNGAIWQIGDEEPLKLRCHVGHSFTGEVFSADQSRNIESALWTAIRIMEEKVTFSRQLAERKRKQNLRNEADAYEKEANALDNEVTKVRDLIVCGIGNQRSLSEDVA
ncbi:MAG: chemotaxis protein CheB [Acidobacteriota bacterium]|nr:chemotaxis protein CheB [Acidobacteriota bacterium]